MVRGDILHVLPIMLYRLFSWRIVLDNLISFIRKHRIYDGRLYFQVLLYHLNGFTNRLLQQHIYVVLKNVEAYVDI